MHVAANLGIVEFSQSSAAVVFKYIELGKEDTANFNGYGLVTVCFIFAVCVCMGWEKRLLHQLDSLRFCGVMVRASVSTWRHPEIKPGS